MTRWEYFVAPVLEHNPAEILNTFGEDGWELVASWRSPRRWGRRRSSPTSSARRARGPPPAAIPPRAVAARDRRPATTDDRATASTAAAASATHVRARVARCRRSRPAPGPARGLRARGDAPDRVGGRHVEPAVGADLEVGHPGAESREHPPAAPSRHRSRRTQPVVERAHVELAVATTRSPSARRGPRGRATGSTNCPSPSVPSDLGPAVVAARLQAVHLVVAAGAVLGLPQRPRSSGRRRARTSSGAPSSTRGCRRRRGCPAPASPSVGEPQDLAARSSDVLRARPTRGPRRPSRRARSSGPNRRSPPLW